MADKTLTAGDVMTREVITVTPATPISEFARICTEDAISGAPVVRVDGTLVGIISKTDLIQGCLDGDSRFGTRDDRPAWDDPDRQVGDIMVDRVLTASPETPLSNLAERMAAERVHRVVVTENDAVVGIVTSIDLLKHYPR